MSQKHQKASNFIEFYKSRAFDDSPPPFITDRQVLDGRGQHSPPVSPCKSKAQRYLNIYGPTKQAAENSMAKV
jgi:hypothetical protein